MKHKYVLTNEVQCEEDGCVVTIRIPIRESPEVYGWYVGSLLEAKWILCPKHKSDNSFQKRSELWALDCFGEDLTHSIVERFDRFIEEVAEFAQSCGISKDAVLRMVEYVYSEKIPGDPQQELGGVMVTLAVLCEAIELDMTVAGENELQRIIGKVDEIRKKNINKPRLHNGVFDTNTVAWLCGDKEYMENVARDEASKDTAI